MLRDNDGAFDWIASAAAREVSLAISQRLSKNRSRKINVIRTRSDFEKHLTIKNCDKTFLKIILRLKNC